MNQKKLEKILNEIPLPLEIDQGILEFYEEKDRSLGVSYEKDEDGNPVYIFNAFWKGEYINISGAYTDLYDGIPEILAVWNQLKKGE